MVQTQDSAISPSKHWTSKRIAKILALVAFNIIAVQLLLEWLAAFVMLPMPSYLFDHHFPYAKVESTAGPVSATWVANSRGFHDVEHASGKVKGRVRIVTIGDSFLAGPQHVPLPTALNGRLAKHRSDVEVINLSLPAIDTHHYYQLFKHALNEYRPDIVMVFIFAGNDFRGMEQKVPKAYDRPATFFARFPRPSYYGRVFPRSSIIIADGLAGRFVHRWSALPDRTRWAPQPVRSLDQVADKITEYVALDAPTVRRHLEERLTDVELDELVSHGVRLDMLAYMVAIGMDAKFTARLGVKEHRPEIADARVADAQVMSVLAFLSAMNATATHEDVEFHTVLIPLSHVDPRCADLYERLGAGEDPLFTGTRMAQMSALRKRLVAQGVSVIDLSEALSAVPGTYLRFDTHWAEEGVAVAAQTIDEWLARSSRPLAGEDR